VDGRPRGKGGGEGHGNAGAAFLYRRAEVHDVPVGWHHAAGEDLGRNVPAPRRGNARPVDVGGWHGAALSHDLRETRERRGLTGGPRYSPRQQGLNLI
jgi:hypothetical protein